MFRVVERTVYDVVDVEKEQAGMSAHDAAYETHTSADEAGRRARELTQYRHEARDMTPKPIEPTV